MNTASPNNLTVPRHIAAVDATWIENVLRGAGHQVDVGRITCTRMAEGVGMLSSIYRVQIDYVRGTGPATVVVKLPALNEQNHGVAMTFNNYEREARFYQRAAGRTAMRTPTAYYAAHNGTAEFVLVLEDMSDWAAGDQLAGSTPEQTRHCIDALAQLHASFWGRVDDGAWEWVPNSSDSLMSQGLYQGTVALYDPFLAEFGADVPTALHTCKARFIAALPAMQRWIDASPRTLIQGDFRMDNLFFGRTAQQSPVAVCDWGASLRGKGVHDVAYLLVGSVPTADRRTHEQQLIARWQQGLAQGGVRDYSLEQAWADYRCAVLYMWTYVVVTAGSVDPNNARGRAWIGAMVQRAGAAIDDLGSLELLAQFE